MCEICHQAPCDCRCPNAQVEFVGNCAECHEPITTAFEYFKDSEGNLFCTKECADAFHGICCVNF